MRSYGIKIIAVTVIVVIALAFLLRSSSEDTEKYTGGTLIKAGDEAVHAFSNDCEAFGYEVEESEKEAVHAYAKNSVIAERVAANIYASEIEAFIDSTSDSLVCARKPKV